MFAFVSVLALSAYYWCDLWAFVVKKPFSVAVPHRATILPPRAHRRHNVIRQSRLFSSPRAAALSVAALNMDDTTFSMSSNVIIFIVNLLHL